MDQTRVTLLYHNKWTVNINYVYILPNIVLCNTNHKQLIVFIVFFM